MATREKLRLASVRSLLVWLQFTVEKYFQSCQVAHWCRICLPIQKAQELGVRPLGREDPPEEEMATHSSISSLGNLMGRGTWWDHKQLDTTECTHAHTHVLSQMLPHLFPQTILLYSQRVTTHQEAQRGYVTPQDFTQDRARVGIQAVFPTAWLTPLSSALGRFRREPG